MFLATIISLLQIITFLLAIVILVIIMIELLARLNPALEIRLIPCWVNEREGSFILKIEIFNQSRVRIIKESARLQLLEHSLPNSGQLSEWVPFSKDKIVKSERPVEWHEPIEIFESTQHIEPGATISTERLHHFNPEHVLHVGLQLKNKPHWLEQKLALFRPSTTCWTATTIVMRFKS